MYTRLFAAAATAATLALSLAPAALSQATPQQYTQTNLVSNVSGEAAVTDPNLQNAWGLSRSSGGDWWVSDNTSGLSTLYSGTTGAITPLVVTIPTGDKTQSATGSPTGTIFNGTTGFTLAAGKPALFLFATEDGTISGWNPGVSPGSAVITVNEKSASVFKGLTMASAKVNGVTANYLYVADFRKARIAVYDTNFKHATWLENAIAKNWLPKGFAPFNVQNLGGNLYVTLAKQDAAKHDEEHGAGLGEVAVITPEGKLIQVFQYGSWFNAPWGVAIASGDFGAYSHDVLVGNFGDGTINAFDPITGQFLGKLLDKNNKAITIPGLWGLSFGNGTAAGGPATTLFFGAGPQNEANGLFGAITALSNPAGNDQ
jgi:uncharacterized protein (TIGR03118 family)